MNRPKASIKHSSLVNLAGALAPLLLTLLTLPLLLPLIGEFRYGALMLVWALVGYMGVLDLGLGRAVSQRIARLADARDERPDQAPADEPAADILWSALWLSLGMGLLGGAAVVLAAPWLANSVFAAPPELRAELEAALGWMPLALSLATLSSVFMGALQGRHAFVPLNIAQASGGAASLLLPLGFAMGGLVDLSSLFMAMLIGRAVQLALLYRACRRAVSAAPPRLALGSIPALLRFGGWVSVSSTLNPVLELTDRFVIGHRLDLAAVTAYTVPYSLATRLSIIPGSLASVLFPRFSSASGDEARALMRRARMVLVAIMTPLILLGIFAAPPFLQLWLGASLGERMGPTAVILLAGVWINALAYLPYSYLQAQGRPDLPAKLHLAEVAPYLALLWWAVGAWGIEGAALAWTLRVALDGALLFIIAAGGDRSAKNAHDLLELLPAAALIAAAALFALFAPPTPPWQLGLGALLLALAGAWQLKNTPRELRDILRRKLAASSTPPSA